jgi:hypothetical protein
MKDVKEIGRRRGLEIRAVAGGGGRVMKPASLSVTLMMTL